MVLGTTLGVNDGVVDGTTLGVIDEVVDGTTPLLVFVLHRAVRNRSRPGSSASSVVLDSLLVP